MCYFRHIKTGLAQSPLRLILASGQTIPNVSREHLKNLQRKTNKQKKNMNALKLLKIKSKRAK